LDTSEQKTRTFWPGSLEEEGCTTRVFLLQPKILTIRYNYPIHRFCLDWGLAEWGAAP
jgi:hypothetical protein